MDLDTLAKDPSVPLSVIMFATRCSKALEINNFLGGTWNCIYFDYESLTVGFYRDSKSICIEHNGESLVTITFEDKNDLWYAVEMIKVLAEQLKD